MQSIRAPCTYGAFLPAPFVIAVESSELFQIWQRSGARRFVEEHRLHLRVIVGRPRGRGITVLASCRSLCEFCVAFLSARLSTEQLRDSKANSSSPKTICPS